MSPAVFKLFNFSLKNTTDTIVDAATIPILLTGNITAEWAEKADNVLTRKYMLK